MLRFLVNCVEKAKKVVRRRTRGYDNGIPSGSAYLDGKYSLETVCVDSSSIETKKREKTPLTTAIKKGKGKDPCLCKL
ncbi:hypothetical protein [Methanomethylovorans sp.]|uniref:hypothetical protein n=1 Tax=Methanomethylovorans sp. TaxID=2758717 RepID=UPI00351C7230